MSDGTDGSTAETETAPTASGTATDGGSRRDRGSGPKTDPDQVSNRDADPDPDIDDVLDDLEDLEEMVDSPAEREQVREAMRTARRAGRPRVVGRVRDAFDLRDAGEALVGSFIFGIPMIVEGGTLEIGEAIADSPLAMVLTALFGFAVVLGILYAARFDEVESDFVLGLVPGRLVGIVLISVGMSVGLMTLWGRVDWSDPAVAGAQCLVTAVVMGVGASLGDILPE